MYGMTEHGSELTLKAGDANARASFGMDKFTADKTFGNNAPGFSLREGGEQDLMYTLTVKNAQGVVQVHELTGNTRLLEDEAGNITVEETTEGFLEGTDGQDILINLIDGGQVRGNGGNDIIFNMAQDAVLDGGDGNDVITSLGNNTSIHGGDGNDVIVVDKNNRGTVDTGAGDDVTVINGVVTYEGGRQLPAAPSLSIETPARQVAGAYERIQEVLLPSGYRFTV